jgi:hypothetical protein
MISVTFPMLWNSAGVSDGWGESRILPVDKLISEVVTGNFARGILRKLLNSLTSSELIDRDIFSTSLFFTNCTM